MSLEFTDEGTFNENENAFDALRFKLRLGVLNDIEKGTRNDSEGEDNGERESGD